LDALRHLVYQAAWSLEAGREGPLAVSAAVAYGSEALRRLFMHAHQVHGAIGFSTEHDLHLFTRRAKAAELQWGSPARHHERVAPGRFRGVAFPALVARVRPDVPSLRDVLVVDELEAMPQADRPGGEGPDPNRVAVILYTSGTTAEPKGVLHSATTLAAECHATIGHHRLGADDVLVMPSPVSHISGLLYGILLPAVLGATSVLME